MKEQDLYPEMCDWFLRHLKDNNRRAKVRVIDSHAYALDKVLEQEGVVQYFPDTVGLGIQIDVLGIVEYPNKKPELHFIEAKLKPFILSDLLQIFGYCKLCNPSSAYLFSPGGLGILAKLLINLHREDMLDYGSGKIMKKIFVAKWDITTKSPAFETMLPKI